MFKQLKNTLISFNEINTILINPHSEMAKMEYIRYLQGFKEFLNKEYPYNQILECNNIIISSNCYTEGDAFVFNSKKYNYLKVVSTLCF